MESGVSKFAEFGLSSMDISSFFPQQDDTLILTPPYLAASPFAASTDPPNECRENQAFEEDRLDELPQWDEWFQPNSYTSHEEYVSQRIFQTYSALTPA